MASNAHDTGASSEDDWDYVPPPEAEEIEEIFAQAYLERLLASDLEGDEEGEGEDDGGGETVHCTFVPRPS